MTHTDNPPPYTVVIDPSIADGIDQWHSPVDGAIAVGQVRQELPLHHAQSPTHWWHRCQGLVRLYKGGFAWSDLGFSYVQIGSELHVLATWHNRNVRCDVTLPHPDTAIQVDEEAT